MLSVAGYIESFDVYKMPSALAWQTMLWSENHSLFLSCQGRLNYLLTRYKAILLAMIFNREKKICHM